MLVPILLILNGCRTLPPIAPADLSTPGWTVRQAQALWRSNRTAPEMAGDLLLAYSTHGAGLAQFTKSPFPIVTARIDKDQWEVEFDMEHKGFRGRGQPPNRIVWLSLVDYALHRSHPTTWRLETNSQSWIWTHPGTGEQLTVFFNEPL